MPLHLNPANHFAQVQLSVKTLAGQVVIEFSRPTDKVVLPPGDAIAVANALSAAAKAMIKANPGEDFSLG